MPETIGDYYSLWNSVFKGSEIRFPWNCRALEFILQKKKIKTVLLSPFKTYEFVQFEWLDQSERQSLRSSDQNLIYLIGKMIAE